jgi:hypothetical protein
LPSPRPTRRPRPRSPALHHHHPQATLLFKLGALTLKTASKPLAARFEAYVLGHPVLRARVVAAAQWAHRLEIGINRGAEGKTGRVFVGAMSEEAALQLASKAVSEGFVYTVAIGLLVVETNRRSKEDGAKKAAAEAERRAAEELHLRHVAAEETLAEGQAGLAEVLRRVEQRVDALEAALASGSAAAARRR